MGKHQKIENTKVANVREGAMLLPLHNVIGDATVCCLIYLRTPHMLEKIARELRSIVRSPPAITDSANGMMMSGTKGLMQLSMMLRFSSYASAKHTKRTQRMH